MYISRNQKGSIIPMLVIGIILLVALGGFVFWRMSGSDEPESVSSQDNNSSTEQTDEDKPSLFDPTTPEGYVDFDDKTLGVAFKYPGQWGAATVKEGSEVFDVKYEGEWKVIQFSGTEIYGEMVSPDFVLKSGPEPNAAPVDYRKFVKVLEDANEQREAGSDWYSTYIIDSDETSVVYAGYDCPGGGYWITAMEEMANDFGAIGFIYQSKEPKDTCDSDKEVIEVADKEIYTQFSEVLESLNWQ